jgi:hypothetical protein
VNSCYIVSMTGLFDKHVWGMLAKFLSGHYGCIPITCVLVRYK